MVKPFDIQECPSHLAVNNGPSETALCMSLITSEEGGTDRGCLFVICLSLLNNFERALSNGRKGNKKGWDLGRQTSQIIHTPRHEAQQK